MRRIFFVLLAAVLVVFSTFSVSAEDTNVFMKNSSAKGKVALTFDDGPHPRYTPAILDILEEYGIKATFFVIGRNVEIVIRIDQEAMRLTAVTKIPRMDHKLTFFLLGTLLEGGKRLGRAAKEDPGSIVEIGKQKEFHNDLSLFFVEYSTQAPKSQGRGRERWRMHQDKTEGAVA